MKKISIILLGLIFSIVILTNTTHAVDGNWYSANDGYDYYQLPSTFTGTTKTFTLTVDSNESIEIFDQVYNHYVTINEKTFELKIEYLNGWFDLYYIYGTNNYPAGSFVSYESILQSPSVLRKLSSISEIPADDLTTVDNLPKTSSSDNNFIDGFGRVNFTVEGMDILVRIVYYGEHKLKYTMAPGTDMSLFNTIEALYLNLDGETPQIYINNGSDRYLSDMINNQSKAFVPHTIWDLKSNDLSVVNSYNAHVLIKQNNEGLLMAYYYTDALVMDNILAASLEYTTRIKTSIFGVYHEYSEWRRTLWEYTSSEYIEYKDLTLDWKDMIPSWSIYALGLKMTNQLSLPRIDVVDFSNLQPGYNISLSEVNNYFRQRTENFEDIIVNSNYKLFAFSLGVGVSIDAGLGITAQTEFYNNTENTNDVNNFKIMRLVYITDGKLYTTVGDDMNLDITVDPPLNETTPPEKHPLLMIWDWIVTNWLIVLGIVLFVVGLPVIGFVLSGMASVKNGYNALSQPRYNPGKKYRKSGSFGGLLIFLIILVIIFLIAKGLG